MHLTLGNTILAKCIKARTVKDYLLAAADMHTSQGFINPTHNLQQRRYHLITDILTETKRWESMPNRREPLTWAMIEPLQSLRDRSPPIHTHAESINQGDGNKWIPTSMVATLIDWFIVGMFAGFRLSEWAQPDSRPYNHPFQLGCRGDSLAITASDISITAQGFSITWRYQKNNQNGEKLLFQATYSKSSCTMSLPGYDTNTYQSFTASP